MFAETVRAAQQGDTVASEELVRRYQTRGSFLAMPTTPMTSPRAASSRRASTSHRPPHRPFQPWLLTIIANEARNRLSGATVVTLIGSAGEALSKVGNTGLGMMLLEIAAGDDDEIFMKKMIGGGEMEVTTVRGRTAIWIENGVLTMEPVEGLMVDLLDPAARRSGNVLIWSDRGVTYRLETALPKADAVRIAASLAPAPVAVPP